MFVHYILNFSKILCKYMHISANSYYTITDAKLYRGFMYQATLLGGYASLSDQTTMLQGPKVGAKKSNGFGSFRIGWFELGSWTSWNVGSLACIKCMCS